MEELGAIYLIRLLCRFCSLCRPNEVIKYARSQRLAISEARMHPRRRATLLVRRPFGRRIHALREELHEIRCDAVRNHHDLLEQLRQNWVSRNCHTSCYGFEWGMILCDRDNNEVLRWAKDVNGGLPNLIIRRSLANL